MQVEGLDRLKAKMELLKKKYGEETASVVVGFTQRYALHVHEDLEAKHPVGQAKFLEQPARQLQAELSQRIVTDVARGLKLDMALKTAALLIQREAQQLVPVDTSALKASAFTCTEDDLERVSAEAFAKSDAIQQANEPAVGRLAGKKGIGIDAARRQLYERRTKARAKQAERKRQRKS